MTLHRSFYALSKLHHPDHNPSDPNASKRFVEISEAYGTLRIPAKKQAYDREHIHVAAPHASATWRPAGSYSSSQSFAGGRPASGLSRRKTQFRGPPPSFYRSGGWGEHSAKRQEAQSNGAPGAEKPDFGENVNASSGVGGGGGGGLGFGDRPYGHGFQNDVPHFDRDGHYRTHLNNERHRKRRRHGHGHIPHEGPSGILANFVVVGAVIGFVAFAPAMVYGQVGGIKKSDRQTR